MLTQLEGKPFTLTLEGKSRKIGKIEAALISGDRQSLMVTVQMTDEEAAGILGAAQDKNEEQDDPGPFKP